MADTGLPLNVPFPLSTDLVRDGAAAIQAVAEVLNAPTGAFRYAGTRYFTSSGDFEKADPLGTGDIGLRAIRVRLVGGGGGGAGVDAGEAGVRNGAGAGGGAGAYAESFITDIAGLDATITVTRGAGGSGGTGGGFAPNGGTSSFGSLVIGSGGVGGEGFTGTSLFVSRTAGGGPTGTGDLVIPGNPGNYGGVVRIATAAGAQTGGSGGHSMLGAGGEGNRRANGLAGQGFGSGGGGASTDTNVARNGGAGANGIVIVDCFV